MRIDRRTVLGLAGSLLATPPSRAQAPDGWPGRPVRLVVAYPAGGSIDLVGRLLAEPLGRAWGQPVVVENRAGAAGTLGAEVVARAAPDGTTLLVGASSELAVAASTLASLPYAPARDFAPVALLTLQPFLLLVPAALPATSLAELVALARAFPGKLNFGSSGIGTSTHLMAELLRAEANIDIAHIPYRGGPPVLTDLMAGRLDLTFDTIPSARPHLAEGRLRALALCHDRRMAALPGVPTAAEAGMPALTGGTWAALVAPARTPPEVLARIGADIAAALRDGLADALAARGVEPQSADPVVTAGFLDAERAKWAAIAQRAGVRPD